MYISHLMQIFDEVYRVLKSTGSCWVNLGDTYNGSKIGKTDRKMTDKISSEGLVKTSSSRIPNKCLCNIPSRFAIEMTESGWCLRNEIIWHKPNVMPSAVDDRFTIDFEKIFFFTKMSKGYYFKKQLESQKRPNAKTVYSSNKRGIYGPHTYSGNTYNASDYEGRNMRTVWTIPTSNSRISHKAMFPCKLIETPIKSCCPPGGTVLDPFCGSGTTLEFCRTNDIDAIGIEINEEYKQMIINRSMMNISNIDSFLKEES